MDKHRRSRPLMTVLATFTIAFLLLMLPVPPMLRWIKPDFVLLVLIFWLMRTPESFGIGSAWMLGMMLDGVSGNLLGQHALSFSCIAYFLLMFRQHVRMLDPLRQALLVFLLLGFDAMVADWVNMVMRGGGYHFQLLAGAVTGALLWPLLYSGINRYQRLSPA